MRREQALAGLLRELGPRLRRGGLPEPAREPLPTGIAALDELLGGGLPRGRLSEIAGSASSGRTSLALALLAATTRTGEVCAVVDAADGFDPRAAETAGVVLPRVLWVRAPAARPALRATSRLLETEGFGLVLLHAAARGLAPSAATFARLARAAAATHTALVTLSLERTTGTAAEVALEMGALRARFAGTPPLLETVEAEARLVRHRTRPADRSVRLQLHAA